MQVLSRADLVKWEDLGGSSLHPGILSLLAQMQTCGLEWYLAQTDDVSQVHKEESRDK